eukprot:scaffold54783_cov57-Phaeocystis_antarctica.AAC.2
MPRTPCSLCSLCSLCGVGQVLLAARAQLGRRRVAGDKAEEGMVEHRCRVGGVSVRGWAGCGGGARRGGKDAGQSGDEGSAQAVLPCLLENARFDHPEC